MLKNIVLIVLGVFCCMLAGAVLEKAVLSKHKNIPDKLEIGKNVSLFWSIQATTQDNSMCAVELLPHHTAYMNIMVIDDTKK